MVTAVNDGFGESEPAEINIVSDNNTFVPENNSATKYGFQQNQNSLLLNITSDEIQHAGIKIYNLSGSVLLDERIELNSGFNSKIIDKNIIGKGLLILELHLRGERITKKIVSY
ncbi:MAG TPA: hypothetical protein VLA03_07645 [Draconibacterium sp.]|nr:hypothetical protein [Draconibacterium sp.]